MLFVFVFDFLVDFCLLSYFLSILSHLSDISIGPQNSIIVFLHDIRLCGGTTILIALTKWTRDLKPGVGLEKQLIGVIFFSEPTCCIRMNWVGVYVLVCFS